MRSPSGETEGQKNPCLEKRTKKKRRRIFRKAVKEELGGELRDQPALPLPIISKPDVWDRPTAKGL